MERSFMEAMANRRSYYALSSDSTISDDEIKGIISDILLNSPSAYNSQTTRIVLLLRDHHIKFWDIVKEKLREIVSADKFSKTEKKINDSFASGYGTILFYEDMASVGKLQEKFPAYSDNFAIWSDHTSAIHQFAIWTALEDKGLGASLQHYNPLIDDAIRKEWIINPEWRLIAQMPFGKPIAKAADKEYLPLKERLLVFE